MKRQLLLLPLAFFLFFTASAEKCTTLHQQLIGLNKYWNTIEPTDYLKQSYPTLNEKEIIQLHLFMVKDILSQKDLNHLTAAQENNRRQLLLALEAYAQNGVFPINEFHNTRTPYFIDSKGTACAVGQLIIESGHKDLSLTIAKEFNYRFIEDMPQENLNNWADQYGFTVSELKWIQPAYGPSCQPGQVMQPNCKDGVGCFNPDWQGDGLIAPVSYFSEYNDGTGWVVDSSNVWQFSGARIGQHRITITDSLNASMVYLYTINNVPAIPIQETVVDQSSAVHCNGKITLNINDTSGTYIYELINTQLNYFKSGTQVFDSLCTGTYLARVSTGFNCINSKTIVVNNSTGLDENNLGRFIKIQSPFQRYLEMDISLSGNKSIRLYSMKGELVYDGTINSNRTIDLGVLDNGLYVVQIEYKGSIYNGKIIKTN